MFASGAFVHGWIARHHGGGNYLGRRFSGMLHFVFSVDTLDLGQGACRRPAISFRSTAARKEKTEARLDGND